MILLDEIKGSIYHLQDCGCDINNLRVTMSELVFNSLLLDEINNQRNAYSSCSGYLFGVKMNVEHPYNEIVIYDSKKVCYNQEFLIVIKINVNISNHDTNGNTTKGAF